MKIAWFTAALLFVISSCGASRAHPDAPTPTIAGVTPETPSREDVVRAMSSVTGAVTACGRGTPGTAKVRLVFDGSGTVAEASIEDQDSWLDTRPGPGCDSTPDSHGYYQCRRPRAPDPEVDPCILRAVRTARVPPFSRASYSVSYPFRY